MGCKPLQLIEQIDTRRTAVAGNPVLTQFSDSLVISVDDDRYGRDALQNALYSLTSNLIDYGFLLRGGVTRGELFHDVGLVFGPALIEAYE